MDRLISKSKYNRKNLVKFYKFHMFHRSKLTYLIVIVMLFVLYNTIRQSFQMESITHVLISWAIVAFTIMLIPMMMIFQVNDIVRKETQERKDSVEIITATKDKITRNTDKIPGKVIIGWNQILSIRETREFIYIYTGPKQGIFIPKENIVEGDVELFRKLAKNNLKKNRRGKVDYKVLYKVSKNDR